MTLLFVLAGFGILLAVALLAVGRLGELAPVAPDRAPLDLPDHPMHRVDVDAVRFAVGFRGYRMDEVDDVLDRLAADLAARDARIAALEAAGGLVAPDPGAPVQDASPPAPGGAPVLDAVRPVTPAADGAAPAPAPTPAAPAAPAAPASAAPWLAAETGREGDPAAGAAD